VKPAFKLGQHATSFVYFALGIAALAASMLIMTNPDALMRRTTKSPSMKRGGAGLPLTASCAGQDFQALRIVI